jgi:hypothetical protein
VSVESESIRVVFDAWVEACQHPRAKLTADRRAKVRARLKEGYTTDDLIRAVQGAAKGAYTDARGHTWDDLSLVCRSGSNVERFIDMAEGTKKPLTGKFL